MQTSAAHPGPCGRLRRAHSVMGVATKPGKMVTTLILPCRACTIDSLNLHGRAAQRTIWSVTYQMWHSMHPEMRGDGLGHAQRMRECTAPSTAGLSRLQQALQG
jgi:hypothetical protein